MDSFNDSVVRRRLRSTVDVRSTRWLRRWRAGFRFAKMRRRGWRSRRRIGDCRVTRRGLDARLSGARPLLSELAPATLGTAAIVSHVVHHDPPAP
eukprot:6017836-Pleurochrysis_carterae.AAC.1